MPWRSIVPARIPFERTTWPSSPRTYGTMTRESGARPSLNLSLLITLAFGLVDSVTKMASIFGSVRVVPKMS